LQTAEFFPDPRPLTPDPLACLREARALLRRVTPLRFDCGRLCGAACCKGDEKTGMKLFFGEETVLTDAPDFAILSSGGKSADSVAVCGGVCDRKTRPTACMMFPLYPYLREMDGRTVIDVVPDPRASSVCPIVYEGLRPDRAFARAVRKSARWLLRVPENALIIRETNALFDELMEIRGLIQPNFERTGLRK